MNKLFNFEENIFKYISEANLAISRGGASTLSELAFLKVPFITIPFKHAKDDHQLENAIYYEKKDSYIDLSGKIIKILVDDTTPIEFDQPLFLIDPS